MDYKEKYMALNKSYNAILMDNELLERENQQLRKEADGLTETICKLEREIRRLEGNKKW